MSDGGRVIGFRARPELQDAVDPEDAVKLCLLMLDDLIFNFQLYLAGGEDLVPYLPEDSAAEVEEIRERMPEWAFQEILDEMARALSQELHR